MAEIGKQTEAVIGSNMCNLFAEKTRRQRYEFDFTRLIMSGSGNGDVILEYLYIFRLG